MSDKKRILFITYFFETSDGVGAQRLSYWAKNISEQSGNSISCDVLTSRGSTNINEKGIDNIFCVNDEGQSLFSVVIKDQGYTWQQNIKRFFAKRSESMSYDVVVMSGGPFMQFLLIPFLKKLFNCRVIIDFRDPFATNPHFDNSWIKIMVKGFYERRFIDNADAVITINETCSTLLAFNKKTKAKLKIIENGYDDIVIDAVNNQVESGASGKIGIVYPGKFYDDLNPERFLRIISDKDHTDDFSFAYVGAEDSSVGEFDNFTNHGPSNYSSTIEIINSSDIGLIFTGGKPFESTTKVFDYIGLEKPILIITNGALRTGNLHRITSNYPKVFWAENDDNAIIAVLKQIKEDDLQLEYKEKGSFSRREGLKQLIAVINGAISSAA